MSRFNDESPHWLNWLKFKNKFKHLTFSNSDFQNSVRLRLFIHQQLSTDVICMCNLTNNGNVIPVSNDDTKNINKPTRMFHPLACPSIAAETKKKHDNIAKVIHNFLIFHCDSGKVISQTEERYKCMANGERKKIDIVLSIENVTYYVDVSVFNCGCYSNARSFDESSLDRMIFKEKEKIKEYEQVKLQYNPNLIPFILDTSGNFGPEAMEFIKKVSKHRISNLSQKMFIKSLMTAISVCLFEGLNSSTTVYYEVLNKKIAALNEEDFADKSTIVYDNSIQVD